MNPSIRKTSREKSAINLRAARILAILFAIFISLFAFDVFKQGAPIVQILMALFVHLIPTFIIIIVTWVSWKHPLLGAILFPILGILYFILAQGQHFLAYLLISGPTFLIGLLFLTSYLLGRKTSRN